ncbi:hypothetical protein N483_09120 [Pseudoalteromonas luteoviolacea NCIMB 1944]|uniref:Uncharacterized protein n=2 Tax=Pseudoalteromonas TaxID=53246 RepID=V4HV33_PSEL2|nr:hypothetical protein PL2TA16_00690 [Pseudoalteromonas luteoviolacea 2ta16]KZN43446.1 hypothetical protein N483_09120 [Pseudoalteromonas luteoviolacea NCIMB 1944]
MVFEIWGYVSAIIVFGFAISVFWHFEKPEKIDKATFAEVRVSLNWSNLGEDSFERVLHSYESPTLSIDGDFAKAYAIKLSKIPTGIIDGAFTSWKELPLNSEILNNALELAMAAGNPNVKNWLPKKGELISPRYLVNFNRLTYYGHYTEYVSAFIIDRQDKILYHLEHKI